VDHVDVLTLRAERLLFEVLDGPHSISHDIVKDIREWEQRKPGCRWAWVRWLYHCGGTQSDYNLIANYCQVASRALLLLEEHCCVQTVGLSHHRDGPEPPRALWLNGKRYEIGKPRSKRSWRLLAFFWDRQSATFEGLQAPPDTGPGEPEKPWSEPVNDSAITSAVNRFNNEVPAALPWRLKTEGRCVCKESHENPAT
jgi:hypothetical protein